MVDDSITIPEGQRRYDDLMKYVHGDFPLTDDMTMAISQLLKEDAVKNFLLEGERHNLRTALSGGTSGPLLWPF